MVHQAFNLELAWGMRFSFPVWLLLAISAQVLAQVPPNNPTLDSDHDGLTDAQEQALLEQFEPRFMISKDDCADKPAAFSAFISEPTVAAEDGTIYGQASPRVGHSSEIELHYYHLWRKDCGKQGHNLDAEHVSVLLGRDGADGWKARYWYAAAHEDTLCDASQIVRAKALGAEQHGPQVWISSGKHATFLGQALCKHGCGADDCDRNEPLSTDKLVNVGEPARPMNGTTWSNSAAWPLAGKMRRSDFGEARTTRLERLPAEEIAWANPQKRPVQAAISRGDKALGGAATGFHATDTALTVADTESSGAMNRATGSTGNALAKTYRGVKKALRAAVGKAPEKDK